MSIRLRFTLLYSLILAVTLLLLSVVLVSIQSQTTLNTLKRDLIRGSETVGAAVVRTVLDPTTCQGAAGLRGRPRCLSRPISSDEILPGAAGAGDRAGPGCHRQPGGQPLWPL